MPLSYKLAPKLCENCGTKEESEFTPCVYNICKKCKKLKKEKPYICNNCGESNKSNFVEGRYTICKTCRNTKNRVSKVKEIREEEYKETLSPGIADTKQAPIVDIKDVKETKSPDIKDVKKIIRSFILADYTIFKGYTLPETVDKFELYMHINDEKNRNLEKEMDYIKYLIDNLNLVNEQNKKLIDCNKIFSIEIESLKNKISKLETFISKQSLVVGNES
jgi:hypothetical protein